VAVGVSNQASDAPHLEPMLERIVANTGQQPEQLITDAGYCSKAGQAIYALRKTIVEPVFGQIKGARGLDGFLLRGLEKADGEWTLMAITHNLLKLHRAALNPA
jgi:hypothetical protein